jgi:hypothetical protein
MCKVFIYVGLVTKTNFLKKGERLGAGGSAPIILATQETEIRRIMVQSQPGHIVCEALSQKIPNTKKG